MAWDSQSAFDCVEGKVQEGMWGAEITKGGRHPGSNGFWTQIRELSCVNWMAADDRDLAVGLTGLLLFQGIH